MSEEQLLNMKPGREMDRMAALEIMGYVWATHALRFSAELAAKWISSVEALQATKGVYVKVKPEEMHSLKELEDFDEQVPRFSTDEACAQLVVNEMIQHSYEYVLHIDASPAEPSYRAIFSQHDKEAVVVSAASPASAIIKAALLAIRRQGG